MYTRRQRSNERKSLVRLTIQADQGLCNRVMVPGWSQWSVHTLKIKCYFLKITERRDGRAYGAPCARRSGGLARGRIAGREARRRRTGRLRSERQRPEV